MLTSIQPIYLPSVHDRFQASLFNHEGSIISVVKASNVYDLTQKIKLATPAPYRIGGPVPNHTDEDGANLLEGMLNATFLHLIRQSKNPPPPPPPPPLARLRAIAQSIDKLGAAIPSILEADNPQEEYEDGQIIYHIDIAKGIHAVIEEMEGSSKEMEGSSNLRICQQCGSVSGVDPAWTGGKDEVAG